MHVGNNDTIRSCCNGNVRIVTIVNGEKSNVTLYDVLYVQTIMYNLISVCRVRQNNCRIVIDNAGGDSCCGIRTIEIKTRIESRWWHMKQMRGSI